jgi:hypothetical protein
LLALAFVAAAAPQRSKKPNPDAGGTTGVLASVDAEKGSFTLERVGVDVDDVLLEKMKERGDGKKADEGGKAADRKAAKDPGETKTFTTTAKCKIYVKFRSSPSSGNSVERTLADLEPMVGWPVTVKSRVKADQPIAFEVVAWRGTPWKVGK